MDVAKDFGDDIEDEEMYGSIPPVTNYAGWNISNSRGMENLSRTGLPCGQVSLRGVSYHSQISCTRSLCPSGIPFFIAD